MTYSILIMTRRSTFGLFAATLICCSIGVYALDLARYDAMNGMQEMPQDMGKYNWFTCTGGETNRSCKFNQDEVYRYVSVSFNVKLSCTYVASLYSILYLTSCICFLYILGRCLIWCC